MTGRAPFFFFLFFLTLFRIVYSGWFELSLDEAYYWLWSRHLDISYYDHPPMVAYMIALSSLMGESERFIRLAAVLSASGITWLVYSIASGIFNGRAGFAAAVLINVAPLYGLGGLLMTPDIPLCLFWALSLYSGWKIIDTQRPGWWYALGLSFGLALLSKYNAALFAPAFALFLIFSPENRLWIFRKEPYLAFALSMLVFAPVIYWNYDHDWVSFRFQLSHGFQAGGRDVLKDFVNFWAGQAGLFAVLPFFFIAAAAFGAGWMGVREKRDDYLYLSFMSAPLLAFFLVNSLRTSMEGNWPAPAYMAAIIAAPGFVMYLGDRRDEFNRKVLYGAYTASIALAAAVMVYAHIQIVNPVLPMPQKHEISRRVFGWKSLAAESAARLKDMGDGAFIISNRYQVMSLLRYYTHGARDAYITNGRGRFGYLGSVEHLAGKNALYVTEADRDDTARISRHFDRMEPAGSFRIERHGMVIREFHFYRCYNYHGGLIEV